MTAYLLNVKFHLHNYHFKIFVKFRPILKMPKCQNAKMPKCQNEKTQKIFKSDVVVSRY